MKPTFLFLFAVLFSTSLFSQHLRSGLSSYAPIEKKSSLIVPYTGNYLAPHSFPQKHLNYRTPKFVDVVDMGTSADPLSYGYNGGQRSILQYDPISGYITHIHRMGGVLDPEGNPGDIGYDISTDQGNSFSTMNLLYEQQENLPGHLPQHILFQKPVDTIQQIYMAYLAPLPDGTNNPEGWGGYLRGLKNLSSGMPPENQHVTSDPSGNIFLNTPEDMCSSTNSDVWAVDFSIDLSSGDPEYTGYLIITHGAWNEETLALDYTETLLECPVTEDLEQPLDAKICFSPLDSITGYIAVLGNNDELGFCQNALYPIYWKTTDGGLTWSEPQAIQIGGPEGIPVLRDELLLSDNQIIYIYYPPYPERDEIVYTTAFDFDITIDKKNRLHVATGVGIQDNTTPFGIITEPMFYSMTDIIIDDDGTIFDAFVLDRPRQFRTDIIPEMPEDNRIQAGISEDGTYIVISYLDTYLEGETSNNYPDIMLRALACTENYYLLSCRDSLGCFSNQSINVTSLSDAMWRSYFMNMSDIMIPQNYGMDIIVPFSYASVNIEDPLGAVQYKYIKNFYLNNFCFSCDSNEPPAGYPVSINNMGTVIMADNYTNPFSQSTNIEISIHEQCEVSVEIYNEILQCIYAKNFGILDQGIQTLVINARDLQPGICTYKIKAGNQQLNGKMIVQ